MKPQVKEYFKLSIIYSALGAIPAVLPALIWPYLEGPERLDVDQFAFMAIAETITALVFTIAMLGMNGAIGRFYFDYIENRKGFDKIVASVYNSILMRGALMVGIVLLTGDFFGSFFTQPALQDFSSYGALAVIAGISRAVNFTAAAQYRNEKKLANFIWLSLGMGFIRIGFQVAALFFYEMSFVGYLVGSCIGGWIVSGGVLIYTYWQTGLQHDWKAMKGVNAYAFSLFLFNILETGILIVDKYFLESNPHDLGIYDTALKYGYGLAFIIMALNNATKPEIFRYIQAGVKENENDIKTISNVMMAQIQIIVALAIIPIMVYLDYLFETDLKIASTLITIILIRYILRGQFMVFSAPVFYQKNTIVLFYLNAAAFGANVLINWWLVPVIGYYGAIAGILASQALASALTYFYQKRIISISWNLNKLIVHPTLIVLLAIGLEVIKHVYGLNQFVAAAIVILAIISSVYFLYKSDLKTIPVIGKWIP